MMCRAPLPNTSLAFVPNLLLDPTLLLNRQPDDPLAWTASSVSPALDQSQAATFRILFSTCLILVLPDSCGYDGKTGVYHYCLIAGNTENALPTNGKGVSRALLTDGADGQSPCFGARIDPEPSITRPSRPTVRVTPAAPGIWIQPTRPPT